MHLTATIILYRLLSLGVSQLQWSGKPALELDPVCLQHSQVTWHNKLVLPLPLLWSRHLLHHLESGLRNPGNEHHLISNQLGFSGYRVASFILTRLPSWARECWLPLTFAEILAGASVTTVTFRTWRGLGVFEDLGDRRDVRLARGEPGAQAAGTGQRGGRAGTSGVGDATEALRKGRCPSAGGRAQSQGRGRAEGRDSIDSTDEGEN